MTSRFQILVIEDARADTFLIREALREAKLRGELDATEGQVIGEPLPSVAVREVHVIQLLQNLISNALKYRSSAPPVIHVAVQQQGNICQFSVRDNGMGIDSQYLDDVFEPFRRLHGPDISGSGIGLATCRRIVAKCRGDIWVESSHGQGSTFHFTLPSA